MKGAVVFTGIIQGAPVMRYLTKISTRIFIFSSLEAGLPAPAMDSSVFFRGFRGHTQDENHRR
jgi:hypothetical protein